MSQHIATVQAIYEAFGRGDVPAILSHLADDVEWEVWHSNSAQQAGAPWLQARRGRDAVVGFFEAIGTFNFRTFNVLNICGSGDRVVSEIDLDMELPNGGGVRDEEIHLWTFNPDGKVAKFRHYIDTAKHIAAARGQDTRAVSATA